MPGSEQEIKLMNEAAVIAAFFMRPRSGIGLGYMAWGLQTFYCYRHEATGDREVYLLWYFGSRSVLPLRWNCVHDEV